MSDGEVIKYFLHDFYIKGEICNFNKSVSHSLILRSYLLCVSYLYTHKSIWRSLDMYKTRFTETIIENFLISSHKSIYTTWYAFIDKSSYVMLRTWDFPFIFSSDHYCFIHPWKKNYLQRQISCHRWINTQ